MSPIRSQSAAGSRLSVLVQLLLVAATTVGAGWALGSFFADLSFLPAVLLAAVIGTITGGLAVLLATRMRWRWGLPLVAAIALALLSGVVACTWIGLGEPPTSLEAVRQAASGVLHGWSRMLSVGVPARATEDLLLLPVALGWLAALAAAVLALRTAAGLLPALPPFIVLVVALLLGAGSTQPAMPPVAAYLAGALLLAFIRAGGGGMTRSRLVAGLPVVAVVGVLAVLAGTAVADQAPARFDPRDLRDPQPQVLDVTSPLLGLKAQLRRRTPAELFDVRITARNGTIEPQRIRVAALEAYDGVTWRTDAAFTRPGARLPVIDRLNRPVDITLEVTLRDLPGPWLPVLGQPTAVSAHNVGFSAQSGTLVARGAPPSGTRYRVEAQVPVSDDGLRQALPDTGGTAVGANGSGALDLNPPLPPKLAERARQVMAAESAPFAKLRALEQHLRSQPYGLSAPPGHSYAALSRALGIGEDALPASFAEQHAAAFAVLARAEGFPTRVAVGYRLTKSAKQPDGSYRVTSDAAHAWPEVHLAGYGWVAFEPTDVRVVPRSDQPRQEPLPDPGEATIAQPGEVVTGLDPSGLPGVGTTAAERARTWAMSLVGLVLLIVLGLWSAKRWRRHRRRRSGPAARRVLGAWAEAADRLQEAGLRPAGSATPDEVARSLAESPAKGLGPAAAEPVLAMAPLVAGALYAPWPPTEREVTAAWQGERALRKALDRGTLPPGRVKRRLDPRPLAARWRQ